MADKIYVGRGKKLDKFDIVNISVCLSDLPKDKIQEGKNGKKYVNLAVSAKKETDQYGYSHSVSIDDYQKKEDNSGLPF